MGTARTSGRNLTSDTRIEAAISLLAALTGAANGHISRAAAQQDLTLNETQLDEVIALLQTLADARTGSRALIYCSGNDIVLRGDAGEIEPLRLTEDEALAVSQVLARYQLDTKVRERIERALMPQDDGSNASAAACAPTMMTGDALFGGFYQQLIEAIQDGGRCRLAYRADHDEQAVERVIDPGFIEVAGDTAYLIAWDVTKDAQRRYRLDRVANVTLTEDSVVPHRFRRTSTADSIRAAGHMAGIGFANRAQAEATDWAGINLARGIELPDGTFAAPVSYATEPWLFDQVLAAAGSIRILEPRALRDRFIAYAEGLL